MVLSKLQIENSVGNRDFSVQPVFQAPFMEIQSEFRNRVWHVQTGTRGYTIQVGENIWW